ncbi:MAG: lysophospholipid acyltransferase family protein [Bacteroidia bacterium]
MQAFIFYLALPFIYLLSLLPFSVFYLFSDFVYFLLYIVIGYRKDVVTSNLRNSFPGKSEEEIVRIRKMFYSYLCDLFLETFKTLTISKASALKHCKLTPETKALFEKYHAEKKSVIIVMGHFGNWEWAGNTFSLQCPQQLYVIYHPLTNKKFDGLIYRMRTRFGTKLIAMRDTYKDMVRFKDEINATAFIADQTPAPESAYWTSFLNQDTPVFLGTEKIARKLNYPVVYASVRRIKRGYYEIAAETLFEDPRLTTDGEITEAHTRKLEREIIAQPEIWLWSHKRWKHKR